MSDKDFPILPTGGFLYCGKCGLKLNERNKTECLRGFHAKCIAPPPKEQMSFLPPVQADIPVAERDK
jgi:hypothetical protein